MKLNFHILYDQAIALLGIHPWETLAYKYQEIYVDEKVNSSTISKSKKLEPLKCALPAISFKKLCYKGKERNAAVVEIENFFLFKMGEKIACLYTEELIPWTRVKKRIGGEKK